MSYIGQIRIVKEALILYHYSRKRAVHWYTGSTFVILQIDGTEVLLIGGDGIPWNTTLYRIEHDTDEI